MHCRIVNTIFRAFIKRDDGPLGVRMVLADIKKWKLPDFLVMPGFVNVYTFVGDGSGYKPLHAVLTCMFSDEEMGDFQAITSKKSLNRLLNGPIAVAMQALHVGLEIFKRST